MDQRTESCLMWPRYGQKRLHGFFSFLGQFIQTLDDQHRNNNVMFISIYVIEVSHAKLFIYSGVPSDLKLEDFYSITELDYS